MKVTGLPIARGSTYAFWGKYIHDGKFLLFFNSTAQTQSSMQTRGEKLLDKKVDGGRITISMFVLVVSPFSRVSEVVVSADAIYLDYKISWTSSYEFLQIFFPSYTFPHFLPSFLFCLPTNWVDQVGTFFFLNPSIPRNSKFRYCNCFHQICSFITRKLIKIERNLKNLNISSLIYKIEKYSVFFIKIKKKIKDQILNLMQERFHTVSTTFFLMGNKILWRNWFEKYKTRGGWSSLAKKNFK